MIEEFGWSRTEYTLPRSLGQLVMAFTGFFIGVRVDKYGGRPFMLAGLVVLAISLYLQSLVSTLWQWIVLNGLILTIGAALVGNLVVNVTLSKWFVEIRGRAVALAAMGVSFAGILLTPLITLTIDTWGWRSAWQFLAIGTFLITLPCALVFRRAREDYDLLPGGRTKADVLAGRTYRADEDFRLSLTRREAIRTPSFYLLVVGFGLFVINIGVMLIQTIPFMTDAGFDRTTAAMMITVASVPAFLSKPIWGLLIDRLNPQPLAAAGAAITGGALFVIVFAAQAQQLSWIYTGYFLLGCGWGGMIPMQEVIWAGFFGRRYLGAVRSAALPFSLVLSAGAPLAVSWAYDVWNSYNVALLIVAGANVISAFMILFVPNPKASRDAETSP